MMASEMSKDVKFFEEEVTSHPRILKGEEQNGCACAAALNLHADAGRAAIVDVQVRRLVVGVGRSESGGDAGVSDLCRLGSFSLPPRLCREIVEEVWAKINREPRPVHDQPLAAPLSSQLLV
ncbi:hypothetical protein VPH35_054054 [Triticum aestivum]|uniref:Uncharacterized protein n=1 Tax=Triticum turgidum subsp. durum TaxID=4567 RepID=A0A9R1QR02_TRITD|nr:unnamed protein product [Triticum turgidum subsp. durum]